MRFMTLDMIMSLRRADEDRLIIHKYSRDFLHLNNYPCALEVQRSRLNDKNQSKFSGNSPLTTRNICNMMLLRFRIRAILDTIEFCSSGGKEEEHWMHLNTENILIYTLKIGCNLFRLTSPNMPAM